MFYRSLEYKIKNYKIYILYFLVREIYSVSTHIVELGAPFLAQPLICADLDC